MSTFVWKVNVAFDPPGPVPTALKSTQSKSESFTMVTPGQEYTITVNKWSIKNIESRAEVKKIVIPPMELDEAEAIALDSTNIYLKFAPPTEGDFDKFITVPCT